MNEADIWNLIAERFALGDECANRGICAALFSLPGNDAVEAEDRLDAWLGDNPWYVYNDEPRSGNRIYSHFAENREARALACLFLQMEAEHDEALPS